MKKVFLLAHIFLLSVFSIQAQVDRSKRPESGPARAPEIGSYKMFMLKNGLKVFVVEDNKLPRVNMSLILDRDPIAEGQKAGYVSMAGDMIGRGTTNRTKEELDKEVDFIGARLNSSATGISVNGLSKYTEKLVELMADVALNPSMTQEEFDKAKEQFLAGIESGKDDPSEIMGNVYNALTYGKNHPYGEIVTEESINAITLDDCKAYHQTYFKPNIAYLAIVGDVNYKAIKKLIKNYFGEWEAGEVPTFTYQLPDGNDQMAVAFVDRQASVQSVIRIGNPIVLRPGDADIDAMRVMNQILGGGSSGRLYMNLREDKGYTYGAYSSWGTDELVSSFYTFAQVRNEVTDSAVQEFLIELDRIRSGEVTETELQLAKASISGSFGRSLEQPGTLAGFALNMARYNLPADYYQNYLKRLEAVTPEDIKRVANQYIAADKLLITIVGKGQDVAPTLERFGTIDYYDIYANPTEAPSFLTMPEGVSAQDVINGYLAAVGGREALNSISAVELNYSATMDGLPPNMSISYTLAQKTPDFYTEIQEIVGFGSIKKVYASGEGSISGMQGNGPVEGDDLKELELQAKYIFPELAYFDAEAGFTVVLEGLNTIDDKEVYQVKITDPLGSVYREYYTVDSGLKYRIEREIETPQGAITASRTITSYQEFDGVSYPAQVEEKAGGQRVVTTLKEVKMNNDVSMSLFE